MHEFRQHYDISATFGLGAHITILFPFRHPDRITANVLTQLKQAFSRHPRFRFDLTRIDRFPSVIYLAPEPAAPFESLTRAAVAQFPDCQPYGGVFTNPVPHLTVAQAPPADDLIAVAGRLRERATGTLPLRCNGSEVALVIKRSERWSIAYRFLLA